MWCESVTTTATSFTQTTTQPTTSTTTGFPLQTVTPRRVENDGMWGSAETTDETGGLMVAKDQTTDATWRFKTPKCWLNHENGGLIGD